jgi:hypothetical protein
MKKIFILLFLLCSFAQAQTVNVPLVRGIDSDTAIVGGNRNRFGLSGKFFKFGDGTVMTTASTAIDTSAGYFVTTYDLNTALSPYATTASLREGAYLSDTDKVVVKGDTLTWLATKNDVANAGGGDTTNIHLQILSLQDSLHKAYDSINALLVYNQAAKDSIDSLRADIGSGGGGEANTMSNIAGAGIALFKQKSGVDLELKRLKPLGYITMQDGTDSVTVLSDTSLGKLATQKMIGDTANVLRNSLDQGWKYNGTDSLRTSHFQTYGQGYTYLDVGTATYPYTQTTFHGNLFVDGGITTPANLKGSSIIMNVAGGFFFGYTGGMGDERGNIVAPEDGGLGFYNSTGVVSIRVLGANRFVGIGKDNPIHRLDVNGGCAADTFFIGTTLMFASDTVTWDIGSVGAGVDSSRTKTVTGAVAGNPVVIGYSTEKEIGIDFSAECITNDQIVFHLYNKTLSSIDPTSRRYKFTVLNK